MFDEPYSMQFKDRTDAGRQLARRLMLYRDENPVVLALPRGGVPVGFEIAQALDAPLDVVAVRKIGAPLQPELGVGAVVDGVSPEVVLDQRIMREIGVTEYDLREQIDMELAEIRRRETLYRGDRPPPRVRDCTVIVVDDGIATGSSVRAVLRALRRADPRRIVLAVPVGPPESIESLRPEADEVVCLVQPPWFRAVGQFYESFEQLEDREVIELLTKANMQRPAARVQEIGV